MCFFPPLFCELSLLPPSSQISFHSYMPTPPLYPSLPSSPVPPHPVLPPSPHISLPNNKWSNLLPAINDNPSFNLPPPNTSLPHDQSESELPHPNLTCLYTDIPSFLNSHTNSKTKIIASLNIQSLQSKYDSLKQFLSSVSSRKIPLDILALQETWHIPYPSLIPFPNYNLIHSSRPTGRGGGIGFLVNSSLQFKKIHNLSPFIPYVFESLTIEIKTSSSQKTSFTSIYRSPTPPNHLSSSQQLSLFNDNLDALLHNLSQSYNSSYIMLDSNINSLSPSPHLSTYNETISSNGFSQTILKATRIQNNSFSLIDHILTNNSSPNLTSGVMLSDISDHFLTFLLSPIPHFPKMQHDLPSRTFDVESISKFKIDLSSITWNDVLSDEDVDSSYGKFWSTFKTLFNLHFPLIKAKRNKNHHPLQNYMTKGLLISRSTKLSLHKHSILNPSPLNISKYRSYRNLYNKLLRTSKKLYFERNFKKYKKDPKRTWSLIREALHFSPKYNLITDINAGDTSLVNDLDIANEFNRFFASAGKNISNSIPPTSLTPESFLTPNNAPDLTLYELSPTAIVDILKLLQPKRSVDIDGLSFFLLKQISFQIAIPLSHIFSLSLKNGIFPSALKLSRVIPLYKSNDPSLCDNYRPIALQSCIAKILEKYVSIQLSNHLDLNHLLHPHQYGFQKYKSTEHNLFSAINFISSALNNNEFCLGIFLDLKKAFDVCSHEILLKKLSHIGVLGSALDWFKSYLSNRTQRVEINGVLSNPEDIDISVLQGSILGPILFLIYINDLPNCTSLFTLLFADDTQALARGNNIPMLVDRVNLELYKLASWFRANKMAVNISKTKFILFHNKGKKYNPEDLKILFNNNEPNQNDPTLIQQLERIHSNHKDPSKQHYKSLGILFDEHLSFSHHFSYLHSKLSRTIFILNRAKHFLPLRILKTLYFSLFHSHLSYCPSITSCASPALTNKIFLLQKKAIRIISGAAYAAHTDPLFKSNSILPYPKILLQANYLLLHSIHHNYSPSSLRNIFPKNNERNIDYDLRNQNAYIIPIPRNNSLKRFPLYSYPTLFNSDDGILLNQNPTTFKIAIKSKLLGTYDHLNEHFDRLLIQYPP